MIFKRPANIALLAIGCAISPHSAFSFGKSGTKASNDDSAAAATLFFIGIALVASGVMIMKNKKFGPEEGFRRNTIRGEKVEVWGMIQVIIGIIFIFSGLSAWE